MNRISKNVFWILTALYFLVGMHINLPYRESYGLGDPNNIITAIYASFVIGCGLFEITRKKIVKLSKVMLSAGIGMITILILSICHFYTYEQNNFIPFLGVFVLVLLLFSVQQLTFSENAKRLFLALIGASGVIEGMLAMFQGTSELPVTGTFRSSWHLGIFLTIAEAAVLFLIITAKKISFLRIIGTLIASGIVLSGLFFAHSMQAFNILATIILITGIAFLKENNLDKGIKKATIWLIIILTAGACIYLIVISNFPKPEPAPYPNESIEMFKAKALIGHGFGTYDSTRAHWLFANFPNEPFKAFSEGSILKLAGIEGGFLGFFSIFAFLYAIMQSILVNNRSIFRSLAILNLSLPIIISCNLESVLSEVFILPVLLVIFTLVADNEKNSNKISVSLKTTDTITILSAVLPIATIAFGVTAFLSLPELNYQIANHRFFTENHPTPMNIFPRFEDYTEGRYTSAARSAQNVGDPQLIMISRESLKSVLPFTTNCNTLQVSALADVFINSHKDKVTKVDPNFDFTEINSELLEFTRYLCPNMKEYVNPEEIDAKNLYQKSQQK